jgi:hypothetical protein
METLITLFVASITGIAGFYFGQKKQPKPLTEEEKIKLQREREEKAWQKLFNYNETIATRGYRDEQ